MADNTVLSVGSGGDIIATDDLLTLNGGAVSGFKVQRVKVGFGSDSIFRDVDANNGMPITGAVPANTTTSGTLSASDAVVAAPAGDGSLITGASTAGSVVAAVVPDGMQAWTLMIKGYVSGTIYTEASNNSTNGTDGDWVEVKGRRTGTAVGVESVTYSMVANGYYRGNAAGFKYIRARLIGGTGPTIQWVLSNGQGATFLNSGIPGGSSSIGTVILGAGTAAAGSVSVSNFPATQAVSGTFFQTTQPVSIATMPTTPVTGTFFQATQPVSGTFFQATQPVSGTFFQATQPVSIAASVAVTGTFFQATQPVSFTQPALVAGAAIIGKVGIDQTTPGTTNAVSVTNTTFGATLAAETTKVIGTVNLSAAQTLATVSAVTAITNALPTGANTIGAVNFATPTAFTLSSAATTNATSVKASAGTVMQIVASNVGAAAAFLKVFNLAVAPTVGTSVPLLTIPIAASSVVNVPFGALGLRFGTGIALSITNLVADADATAVAAAQVKTVISYL